MKDNKNAVIHPDKQKPRSVSLEEYRVAQAALDRSINDIISILETKKMEYEKQRQAMVIYLHKGT